ncbi:MAG: DUF4384 domain-containing protein, partial [Rubrivivax sp.]
AVAAAPAPAPAPAAAPNTLDPFREFERVVQAQSPGFGLQLQTDRPVLRVDRDDLHFTLDSDRDGYLYAFVGTADGSLVQVVPGTATGQVQMKKGQRFRFPMTNATGLKASDPPGQGQVLTIVSQRQRSFKDFNPQVMEGIRIFPTGAEGGAILQRHAGAQPALVGSPLCPPGEACDTTYGAAVLKVDVVK